MIRKLFQIYLLWRMVRKSRLMAKERYKRKYFRASEIALQLSRSERIIIDEKYGLDFLSPAMDLGFEMGEYKKRLDYGGRVYDFPMERYDPKYHTSLIYFETMRAINQYHRNTFWSLLKKII